MPLGFDQCFKSHAISAQMNRLLQTQRNHLFAGLYAYVKPERLKIKTR